MKERFKSITAVYLVLRDGDRVLLSRRSNTGFCDGMFGLPAGHTEEKETLMQAMVREADEELGVVVDPANLQLVHVRDRIAVDGHRVDFYFVCSVWHGEVSNREPEKCCELLWCEDRELDADIIPYIKIALECIENNVPYSFGDRSG